jgi:hypothetical protein
MKLSKLLALHALVTGAVGVDYEYHIAPRARPGAVDAPAPPTPPPTTAAPPASTAPVYEPSTLFRNAEYVECRDNNGCGRDVLRLYDAPDSFATVLTSKRAELTCAQLLQYSDLETVRLTWLGAPLVAVLRHYSYFHELQGRHVWIGELVGIDAGTVTIVYNDACDADVFDLSVILNDDGELRKRSLRSSPCAGADDPAGCTWVSLVTTDMRDELDLDHPGRTRRLYISDEDRAVDRELTTASLPQRHPDGSRRLDDGSVIKVLWLYTARTRAVLGEDKLRSIVAAGVASANMALANSALNFKLRLVGVHPIADTYEHDAHTQVLDDLNAGRVPGARHKRNMYHADLVQVIVNDSSYCGFGSVMDAPTTAFAPFAHSTVYHGCFSTFSHIHEIGHNMGALHDRDNVAPADYGGTNHGLRYCDEPGSFRSVMSYSCAYSTRVPYFSNPTVSYMGRPTGTESCNNAQTLRQNARTVANFRAG